MKAIEKPQLIITTTLFILLAMIVIVLMMSGCVSERIEGNRDLVTQERTSAPFSEVVSTGSFSVKIIPSDLTRIEVKGESNILPYLSTISDGTTITLKFSNGYNIHEHDPVEVFLYTPATESIRLSGSGIVDCGSFISDHINLNISGSGGINGDFETENLEAVISGSGLITLTGISTNTSFNISGSGNIQAPEMEAEHCTAGISGSGNLTAAVSASLNASISGSGSIFYKGNPSVTSHVTGSGDVYKF
jgi:hypothetical protein